MRKHKEPIFGNDKIGLALMDLFYDSSSLDYETQGRVAETCRLLHWGRGMDSVHEMIHKELDHLSQVPSLVPAAKNLRGMLLPRKLPAEAFRDR